jgi:hypothetical protein
MRKQIGSIVLISMLVFVTASAMATKPQSVSTGLDLNATPSQIALGQQLGRGSDATAFCAYDPSGAIGAGVITFNTDTPGTISSLSDWAPGSYGFCTGGTYDLTGNLFMTDYSSSNSAFYSVDTTTWVATLVGNTGHSMHAMTCDPTTGTIYGAGGAGNAANLYTIDPATGASTLVGAFGTGGYVLQLACDADGNMWAIDISTDNFYSVNKDTGVATTVGPTGLALNYAQDMCFDSQSATLILAGYSSFGAEYTVDRATGACTLVGQFAGSMEVDALCFPLGPVQDITPPVTTCMITGTGPVTITLTATDSQSGVNYTMYKIDSGSFQVYTAPVEYSAAGTHTVTFYSVDNAGNIEDQKSQEFTIEATLTIAIKGGMGITATVTNDGADPVDITGSIAVTGLVFPKSKDISATAVAAGADAVTKMTVFGIGPTTITVTANGIEKTAKGFVLLVFVLGVK